MLDGSHYGAKATEHQKKIMRLWIEVGAPYPGTYAALGCGSIGVYQWVTPLNTDFDWPTTKAGAEVVKRRCASCHQGNRALPLAMADELGLSFWRFDIRDPRMKHSRHIVFNLSRPEKSLMLLAPLARSGGGLQRCGDVVFADSTDSDYQELLAMIVAGKKNLETIKRFDMPGFRPRAGYYREMKRYGILPKDYPEDAEVDFYDLDRKYWSSLWYRPENGR